MFEFLYNFKIWFIVGRVKNEIFKMVEKVVMSFFV